MQRKEFIIALFDLLQNRKYLWLKAVCGHPADLPQSSDLDLLVQPEDLPGLLDFACGFPGVETCRIVRKSTATYLELFFEDGGFLQLDLLTALVRKQFEYLPVEYLFAHRCWNNGIATCTAEVMLEHVLFFNFLNHSGLPEKYIRYFLHHSGPGLTDFLQKKYGIECTGPEQLGRYDPAIRARLVAYLKRQPGNSILRRLKTGVLYLADSLTGLRRGSVITFTGVDGAGKTTQLIRLQGTSRRGRSFCWIRSRCQGYLRGSFTMLCQKTSSGRPDSFWKTGRYNRRGSPC